MLSTDQRLTAPAPSLSLDGAASVQETFTCPIFHPCSLSGSQKKREFGREVGEVAVESNGVGCRSEGKGRMDRCCCQDLSAKTNGCSKVEASKTLENSDVVNHQPVCLHLCVSCTGVSVSVWVNEMHVLVWPPTVVLPHGTVVGN